HKNAQDAFRGVRNGCHIMSPSGGRALSGLHRCFGHFAPTVAPGWLLLFQTSVTGKEHWHMELAPSTALLVIDVQLGINRPSNGRRNNPQAEDNIGRLLAAWRASGLPLFHIKHDSTRPDSPFHPTSPGNAIMDVARPLAGEPLIAKNVNGAFVGTDLEQRLRDAGVDTV